MRSRFELRFTECGTAALLFVALVLATIAGPADAFETSIRMESDPGDPIGMGSTYNLTPAQGSFSLAGDAGAVSLTFQPAGAGDAWTFTFTAPAGEALKPGQRVTAVSQSQNPSGLPSMNVSGGNRSCDWISGSFHVMELTADAGGNPVSLWATFEQHCDGGAPALRGDLRVNADIVVSINAPMALFVSPGETIVFFAIATEASGGWVTFSASGVPSGAFFADFFDNSAVFVWTPGSDQRGAYRVTFHGDNGLGGIGEAETFIRVGPPSQPPVASAGGPYAGNAGQAISLDGSASVDPESGPLTYYWDFGDGAVSGSQSPAHAYSTAGSYTARLVVCDEEQCALDEAAVDVLSGMMSARGFLRPEDKVIRLGTGRPYFSVRLEPMEGNFDPASVALWSLTLRSEGTGSVSSVSCAARRTRLDVDSDENKVVEINAAFNTPELRDLFSAVLEEREVPVTVEGILMDGTPFRAELSVTVNPGPGRSLEAKLRQRSNQLDLALGDAGAVTLRIFDVAGRLVSEVLSGEFLPAGVHSLSASGGPGAGFQPGIYFYELRVDGQVTTGRLLLGR